jgi:peptidyl-prolyl cis-trans isomerase C
VYLIFENKEICHMKSLISTRIAALSIALLVSVPMALCVPAQAATATATPSSAPEPAASTVVSKVAIDGKTIEITYGQVKDKLKVLPPQLQNAPFNEIFPLLQKSIETEQIITYLANKAGTQNDPEYQKLVQECQKGVLQKLFLDKEVEKRATEEELKKAYDEIKKAAPKEDEYNLSMITVTDKKKAEKILKDAKAAGPSGFAALADKESMNKIPGGNLGYIRLGDLPEAFRDKVKGAAKATILANVIEVTMPDPSDPNKKVVTYSIILVQDKRPAVFPAMEAVRAELLAAIKARLMKDSIKDLEAPAKVERFGMDGKPIEQKTDAPKADTSKADGPNVDMPKLDAPKLDTSKEPAKAAAAA